MFVVPSIAEEVYSEWPWHFSPGRVQTFIKAMNAKDVQGVQGIHNALTDALDPSKGAGTLLDWLQKKAKDCAVVCIV